MCRTTRSRSSSPMQPSNCTGPRDQTRHHSKRDRPGTRSRHCLSQSRDSGGRRDGQRKNAVDPGRCRTVQDGRPAADRRRDPRRAARLRQRDLERGRAQQGHHKSVAGQADILVVPDLEAGNMLVKQLVYLAGAQAAGIVLGARVPIILTSRADGDEARLASCAIAQLLVRRREKSAQLEPAMKYIVAPPPAPEVSVRHSYVSGCPDCCGYLSAQCVDYIRWNRPDGWNLTNRLQAPGQRPGEICSAAGRDHVSRCF